MPNWRRTLITIWLTEFLAIAGFSMVLPFIPYYVQELGTTDVGEVALWSGLAQSAMALSMAVMAPVWGALSDRFGRKVMVVRATFAGAILMAAMGFVVNVQQLVLLRVGQGVFTGTITAAMILAASVVPKEKSGQALGSLQTAIYLGSSLGPLMGGFIGDTLGYRQCFWVTGALLFISGILVVLLVRENFQPVERRSHRDRFSPQRVIAFLTTSGSMLGALLVARLLMRAAIAVPTPVLPLFVQALMPGRGHVATVTGLVTGVAAAAGAAGSPILGGWGDRAGHRRALIVSGLAAALLYLPQAFVKDVAGLVIWQAGAGFAVGGTLSTLTALLVKSCPTGREGLILGLEASVIGLASALGPMAGAATAAAIGLPSGFILAGGVMGLGTMAVVLWVRESLPATASSSDGKGESE